MASHMSSISPAIFGIGQVSRLVGLSAATVWRQVKRGAFPAPVELSPNRVGWRREDLTRWLAERPSARDRPVARIRTSAAGRARARKRNIAPKSAGA